MSQRQDQIYDPSRSYDVPENPNKSILNFPWEIPPQLRGLFSSLFSRGIASNDGVDEDRRQIERKDDEYKVIPIKIWGLNSDLDSRLYSTIDVDTTHNSLNDSSEIGIKDLLPSLTILPSLAATSYSYTKQCRKPLSELSSSLLPQGVAIPAPIQFPPFQLDSIPPLQEPSSEIQQNYDNDLYRTIEVPNEKNDKEVAAQNVIQSTDPQIQHFSTVPQPPPLLLTYTEDPNHFQRLPPPPHFFVSPPPPPPPPPPLQQQQQQQLWHPPPQQQLWHHPPPAVHLLPPHIQPHSTINGQPTFPQMQFSNPFFSGYNQRQVVSHPPTFVPRGMYVSHPQISSFPPTPPPPPHFIDPYGNFVQPQPQYHMRSHQRPWPELSEMTKLIQRIPS